MVVDTGGAGCSGGAGSDESCAIVMSMVGDSGWTIVIEANASDAIIEERRFEFELGD